MIRATILFCVSFGLFSGCQLSEGNDIPTTNSEYSSTADSQGRLQLSNSKTTNELQTNPNSSRTASYDLRLSLPHTTNFKSSNRYDFNLNTQLTTAEEYSSILHISQEQLSH